MFSLFSVRRRLTVISLSLLALILAACNAQAQSGGSFASVPAGKAYADGSEIYFTHTEASDAAIAEKLTNMMKSPVIHVPALAQVPAESLAEVYVFENGVSGDGPLGFQPDVFNKQPGTEGYSPLRQIILVRWADGASAGTLTSESDILEAQASGELTTSETGVVVNMPFITWDGGKR